MNTQFIEQIKTSLANMLGAGRLDIEVYEQLIETIDKEFQAWKNEIAEELHLKARDWEEIMGPEKEGFYSLGLRRSADFILGKSPLDEENKS